MKIEIKGECTDNIYELQNWLINIVTGVHLHGGEIIKSIQENEGFEIISACEGTIGNFYLTINKKE